jgi:hypothetical protein
MTAKSVTGIIILTLNFAGICFMIFMFFAGRGQRKEHSPGMDRVVKGPKMPQGGESYPMEIEAFNKADYLLDDLDLSEFDDLDLDDDDEK